MIENMRLRHVHMLLLRLITWIVEIMAEEYIIIINCMVQLLLLESLFVFLISIVIDVVNLLLAHGIERLV